MILLVDFFHLFASTCLVYSERKPSLNNYSKYSIHGKIKQGASCKIWKGIEQRILNMIIAFHYIESKFKYDCSHELWFCRVILQRLAFASMGVVLVFSFRRRKSGDQGCDPYYQQAKTLKLSASAFVSASLHFGPSMLT